MGFSGGGGGSGSVATLTDTNLSNPATGQFLGYNTGTGKWQNSGLLGAAALPFGGGEETISAANSSATTTLNLANGNVFSITLVGNTTFAFSGAASGKACAISLYLSQDATGSRTVAWPAGVKWAGGIAPTLTSTANATDVLVFESLNGGTTWFASLVGANFS